MRYTLIASSVSIGMVLAVLASCARPAVRSGAADGEPTAGGGSAAGGKPAAVRLVVNVDDLGASPDAAEGAVRLWEAGAISSVSVMAFGEDFAHTVALLKERGVPTGVHLALNHGAGVLGAAEVPSLHGPDGRLWETVEDTLAHMDLSEVRREFGAQIRALVDAGIRPAHLDSHMGIVFGRPALMEIYRSLALEYGTGMALPASSYFDSSRKALAAASLRASDSLVGIYELPGRAAETPENRAAAYAALLASLPPGLNHLYSHPAPPTDAVKAAYGDHAIRNDDYALFSSPEWKAMLAERRIELANY